MGEIAKFKNTIIVGIITISLLIVSLGVFELCMIVYNSRNMSGVVAVLITAILGIAAISDFRSGYIIEDKKVHFTKDPLVMRTKEAVITKSTVNN